MTKTEFTTYLAQKHSLPYAEAEKALNAVLDSIEDALFKDGRVALPGLGVFQRKERAARQGRNPATGEAMEIPASWTILFRPAAALKRELEE